MTILEGCLALADKGYGSECRGQILQGMHGTWKGCIISRLLEWIAIQKKV